MHRNGKQPVDRLAGSWWEIRATGLGRFSAEVAADISGIPGISRADDLAFVYRLRGNLIWGDILSTGVERDRDGLRVVTRGVDRFGDFAIGAAGSVNVLPVTLLSFDGISLPGRSLLRWETAQEIASSGFRLSRSRWLENRLDSFALLGTIAARGNESGNESGRARYEYLDELGSDAGSDHIYIYRLEETSLAGETVELARVRLRGEPRPGSRENDPALWPNPVAGRRATLRLPRSTGEPVRVDIHSEKGSIVREISDPKRYTGEERIELDLAGLPAGLYLCTISVGDFIVSHPLILLP